VTDTEIDAAQCMRTDLRILWRLLWIGTGELKWQSEELANRY